MSEPGSREPSGTGKGTGTGNEVEIPEEWKSIPIQDYFAKGFKPRIKRKGGREYITLRRGNREKSLVTLLFSSSSLLKPRRISLLSAVTVPEK